MMGLSFLYLYI